MSDTMLIGVLKMPYELAMNSEMSRTQFYDRAQEAVERIETQEETIRRLMVLLKAGHVLSTWADCINWNARDKDNQGEWLDELKDRITKFQELETAFYSDQEPEEQS